MFKEKIDEWKIACLPVNAQEENRTRIPFFELREEKKRTKQLERELRQKEKELAEVALLLLRKKHKRSGATSWKTNFMRRSQTRSYSE